MRSVAKWQVAALVALADGDGAIFGDFADHGPTPTFFREWAPSQ